MSPGNPLCWDTELQKSLGLWFCCEESISMYTQCMQDHNSYRSESFSCSPSKVHRLFRWHSAIEILIYYLLFIKMKFWMLLAVIMKTLNKQHFKYDKSTNSCYKEADWTSCCCGQTMWLVSCWPLPWCVRCSAWTIWGLHNLWATQILVLRNAVTTAGSMRMNLVLSPFIHLSSSSSFVVDLGALGCNWL